MSEKYFQDKDDNIQKIEVPKVKKLKIPQKRMTTPMKEKPSIIKGQTNKQTSLRFCLSVPKYLAKH